MTPEQLKASILQYAIQGKLVEQRPEEGTAEELYQLIQEEKKKLIKEGKIKKEKPLAEITEDEIPFDIPESWKWVRLNTITQAIGDIDHRMPEKVEEGVPYISPLDFIDNGIDYDHAKKISKADYDVLSEKFRPSRFDIIFPRYGTIGKIRIIDTNRDVLVSYSCCTIKNIEKCMDYMYVAYVLQSMMIKHEIERYINKTTQPNVGLQSIKLFMFPLPPLEEQHRIVAKIEELLPYVDRYAEAYEKLEQFNAKFPEEMKKSILQYAIQGKLVEQRPEEGTAEELYQLIQEEKKKLIKEGKIKKEKPLAEITEDEMPFDIPESWKWVRLDEIVCKTIKRGKSPKYVEKSDIQVFAQKCNAKSGGINMDLALYLDEAMFEKYPTEEYMCDGDIVINSTGGGTMGRVGLFRDTDRIENMIIVPDSHVTVIRACATINYHYLYYVLKHNQNNFEKLGEGSTNQTELKPTVLASFVIPLPPLEEQHRIVTKIEELMIYCDKLKLSLT